VISDPNALLAASGCILGCQGDLELGVSTDAVTVSVLFLELRSKEPDMPPIGKDDPEMSYRRGYEHGAVETFRAVERFLGPARPASDRRGKPHEAARVHQPSWQRAARARGAACFLAGLPKRLCWARLHNYQLVELVRAGLAGAYSASDGWQGYD
jgi:hypothetical protein